jgi:hypothetical protein
MDYISTHEVDPWNHLLGSPPSEMVIQTFQPLSLNDVTSPLDAKSFESYLRKWQSMRSDTNAVMNEIDQLVGIFDIANRKKKGDIVCVDLNGLEDEIRQVER